MDLLIAPKLFSSYVNNYSKVGKSVEERLAFQVIENAYNTFILNRKLLDLYELEFENPSTELDVFQNEIVEIINGRSINIASTKDELLEILEETNDSYLSAKTNKESYLHLAIDADESLENNYSAILNNIGGINSPDQIYFTLAAINPLGLTRRYNQFGSNQEIKQFLENIYRIRTHNEINIFDRYTNLTHSYYNSLKNKSIQFKYYTLTKRGHDHILQRSNEYRTLNEFFRRCSMLIYRCDPADLHERRIMFNNIIIEFDNDIANVSVNEPTWKIDVYVCNATLNLIEEKKRTRFTRDITT